jgi:hypothetical protein
MTLGLYVEYLARAINLLCHLIWGTAEHIWFIASISFIVGYIFGRRRNK